MADPRPTNTGFDPEFGDPLKKWRDYLASQGIQTNIISGVRSEQEHQMAWENFLAGQQGRPLPYPDFGPVSKATPPGQTSTHDVGLGADVQPVNRADLPKMYASAPRFGIAFQGASDPYHFNLGNWRQAEATQARPTPWSQVADIPSSYAMNAEADASGGSQPSRPASGAVKVQPDFLTSLQHYESGGRNIPNIHQGTSSGQAQGYNQITTGTWNEFGGQQYAPDPLHATPEQQNAIAAKIPLKRWDPKTLNYLRGQGFTLNPDKTLGENIAANRGAAPTTPGTTLTSVPTAGADGAAAAGAPSSPLGSVGGLASLIPGAKGGADSPAAKMLDSGVSDLASNLGGGGGGGGDQAPAPMQLPTPPQAMPTGGPMMLGSGGQNTFGQRAAEQQLAQQGFMTQPSLAAYNIDPRARPMNMPAGGLGTTLNSPAQWQAALMMGSLDPYEAYNRVYGSS